MSNITQKFLDELMATQEKLADMYDELRMSINHVNNWEEENIGRKLYREDKVRGQITDVSIKNGEVRIESFGFDDIDERYREYYLSYKLDKLLSDNWKEAALKRYQEEQKQKEEEQRVKNETLEREKEAKERAEYERLKAKYE